MKKIIGASLVCLSLITSLSADVTKYKLAKSPLDLNNMSHENGGYQFAIDAYTDGVGMMMVGVPEGPQIDNSKMNKFVFEEGTQAKENWNTLRDFIDSKFGFGSGDDLNIISEYVPPVTASGDPCDDGNPETINDVYIDTYGTCVGTISKTENECYGLPIGIEILVNGVPHLVVSQPYQIQANLDRADTLCTSNVTNMMYLFNENTTFNKDISSWDVSHVTNMVGMFYGASSFNQDISSWNVSNVTDMFIMFFGATNFNQPLNSWDVSNVTNMAAMFSSATSFNQPLNNWNTSHVTGMEQMFWLSSSFNQDLSGWNVSSATTPGFFANGSPMNSTPAKLPHF